METIEVRRVYFEESPHNQDSMTHIWFRNWCIKLLSGFGWGADSGGGSMWFRVFIDAVYIDMLRLRFRI